MGSPHGFHSPRIKYHMVKVPHLWDFFLKKESHMMSQYYIWNLCWRRFAIEGEGLPYGIIPPWGSSAMGFGGGGGRFAIWYYFPLGKFCYGISSGGKVCHMVFLHGERLPNSIIFGGTICHGICSLIMKFVCVCGGGGTNHRGGSFIIGHCFPLGKICLGISSRFAILWYNFRGEVF